MLSRYLVFAAKGIYEPDLYPCPDFYALFKAAKECNCTPWALLEQSVYWRDKALVVQSAENSARKQLQALGM